MEYDYDRIYIYIYIFYVYIYREMLYVANFMVPWFLGSLSGRRQCGFQVISPHEEGGEPCFGPLQEGSYQGGYLTEAYSPPN